MSKLDVNSFYHISLASPWLDKKYDVQITGISSVSTMNELDPTVNLKKEFFNSYNLSITKYLLLINDSTVIYVAKPIKQFDPVTIDIEKKIFIPETLIDFSETFKYSNSRRYSFDVVTGIKHFDSVLDENDFFERSISSIQKCINNIDDFAADTVGVQVRYTDLITTKQELDNIAKERKSIIDKRDMAIKQAKDNQEAMERNLYSKIKEAEKSAIDYEEQRVALTSQINSINSMQVQNELENIALTKIKKNMIEMINKIRDGQMSPESFPTFDELYQQVSGE